MNVRRARLCVANQKSDSVMNCSSSSPAVMRNGQCAAKICTHMRYSEYSDLRQPATPPMCRIGCAQDRERSEHFQKGVATHQTAQVPPVSHGVL